MTWRSGQPGWDTQQIPKNECNLGHLVEGMIGSDAPSGPLAIIMASLIRYCGMKTVVELGVYHGGTAVFLADAVRDTGGTYYGYDRNIQVSVLKRIDTLGLSDYCRWEVCDSWKGSPPSTPIDLLYIDAGHTYEDIAADWNHWFGHVKSGGYIFVDNIMSEPGVSIFWSWICNGTLPHIQCNASFGFGMVQKP